MCLGCPFPLLSGYYPKSAISHCRLVWTANQSTISTLTRPNLITYFCAQSKVHRVFVTGQATQVYMLGELPEATLFILFP
jgi:hypothetical protein